MNFPPPSFSSVPALPVSASVSITVVARRVESGLAVQDEGVCQRVSFVTVGKTQCGFVFHRDLAASQGGVVPHDDFFLFNEEVSSSGSAVFAHQGQCSLTGFDEAARPGNVTFECHVVVADIEDGLAVQDEGVSSV
jgi:hypothetical protein